MSQSNDNNQIHHLRQSAFIQSFIYLHLLLFHLSMPPKSKEPSSPSKKLNAKWSTLETEALILFLCGEAHCLRGTSFKEASLTAAASHIRNLYTEGAVKMTAHCKTKWLSVHYLLIFNHSIILTWTCLVESKIQHCRMACIKLWHWCQL